MKMNLVYALALVTLSLSSAHADTCWKLKGETPSPNQVPKRVCATSAKFIDRKPFKNGDKDREMQITFHITHVIGGTETSFAYDEDMHTRDGVKRGLLLGRGAHDQGPEHLSFDWVLAGGMTMPKDKQPSGTLRELESVRLEYDYREAVTKPGFSYDNKHLTLEYQPD